MSTLNWGVLDCSRNYTRTGAYAQSKLALPMFTRAAGAASGDQILAVSVHPGVLDSGLLPLYGRTGRPIVEGADLVAQLRDPGTALRDGAYDDGPAEAPFRGAGRRREGHCPAVEERRQKCWVGSARPRRCGAQLTVTAPATSPSRCAAPTHERYCPPRRTGPDISPRRRMP